MKVAADVGLGSRPDLDLLAGNEGLDVISDATSIINEQFQLPATLLALLT